MTGRQFLVVRDSPVEVEDHVLESMVYNILDAERPGWLVSAADVMMRRNILLNQGIMQALGRREIGGPQLRGLAFEEAKPIVMKVLRGVFAAFPETALSDMVVLSSADGRLANLSCSDIRFINNVVYSRHPVAPDHYLPIADFHNLLLEDKRAEFVRIATFLGASDIVLESSDSVGREGKVDAGVQDPSQQVEFGLKSQAESIRTATFDLSAKYGPPTKMPMLAEGLRWYQREPLWQAMSEARLHGWVEEFNVSFKYTRDFGVDVNLAATVEGLGLGIGGSFKSHSRVEQQYHPKSAYKG